MDERRRKPVKKGAPQSGKRPPQPQRSAPAGQRRTDAPVQRNNAPAPRKEPQGGVRRTPAPEAETAMRRAMNDRSATAQRKRRRGGNMSVYWVMFVIILGIVFVILANTVLFNCASFETEGTLRYTTDELIAASGLRVGDNLLHIKETEAEERIVAALDYIDTAEVKKIYPTKIMISVKEAEKWYCMESGGKTVCVSRKGKILDNNGDDGLVLIRGYEPVSTDIGEWAQSQTEAKNTLPEQLLNAADAAGLSGITEVDITDRFSITAKIGSRITMKLGNAEELETKFRIADSIIKTQLSPNEEVVLKLDDTDKIAYRPVNEEVPLPPVTQETSETSETSEASSVPEAE